MFIFFEKYKSFRMIWFKCNLKKGGKGICEDLVFSPKKISVFKSYFTLGIADCNK